ncbi:MAG TPA: hypothetical protein PK876_09450, partial [Elusimicrobiota bacterium]|nr:hypothetical protein [Elusimicrobiota bacterium]
MDTVREQFKEIDFDKSWSEDDWELFFRAQDRLVREADRSSGSVGFGEVKSHRALRAEKMTDYHFRQVLSRFGMDPDFPERVDLTSCAESARPACDYWEEGAELESLPIYRKTGAYARFARAVIENKFGRMMVRRYRSPAHVRRQMLLRDYLASLSGILSDLSCAHSLGYQ